MIKTLSNLRPLITENTRAMSLEDVALQYAQNLNPILFATAFEKVYLLALKTAKRFPLIQEDDVVSYTTEKLDLCLRTYEPGKASFSTYFTTVLFNKLREETQQIKTNKRIANVLSDSFEYMHEENGFDIADECSNEEGLEILDGVNLTNREYFYCNMLANDMTQVSISKTMGLSVTTLVKLKNQLRPKFAGAIAEV